MDRINLILDAGWFGLLISGAVWDMKTGRIPNKLSLALLLVSLSGIMREAWMLSRQLPFFRALLYVLVQHGAAALTLALPMLLADLIRPGVFGGGDIKFAFAGGWLLTFSEAVHALAIAFAIGSLTALYCLARKQKARFRFGPALTAGMSGALFLSRFLLRILG